MNRKNENPRIKFEKLLDPNIAAEYQANKGEGILIVLNYLQQDLNDLVETFNGEFQETINDFLGKQRHKKQPWIP